MSAFKKYESDAAGFVKDVLDEIETLKTRIVGLEWKLSELLKLKTLISETGEEIRSKVSALEKEMVEQVTALLRNQEKDRTSIFTLMKTSLDQGSQIDQLLSEIAKLREEIKDKVESSNVVPNTSSQDSLDTPGIRWEITQIHNQLRVLRANRSNASPLRHSRATFSTSVSATQTSPTSRDARVIPVSMPPPRRIPSRRSCSVPNNTPRTPKSPHPDESA
jgi:chromosome segregation ATPase